MINRLLLLRKICFPVDVTSEALSWGISHEDEAIQQYLCSLKKSHVNVVFRKSGLKLSEEFHFIGASADGIVHCDCHGEFLIEVKCPFKFRNTVDVKELLADRNFCLDENMKLKSSHKYMLQIQTQMYVYGINVCHLVLWMPKLCISVVVKRDSNFKETVHKLVRFYKKNVIPELITRKLENASVGNMSTE